MKIRAIDLRPFRNFEHTHIDFETDRTLIIGRNGHGKTNILEAISFLSIGKSVRGARDQQAVPHTGDFFDVSVICGHRDYTQRLRMFFSRAEGKRAFADGDPLERVSDLLGRFRTVCFAPADVSLVLRFPAQRRRLLDVLISQASPTYLHSLQRYQRVLSQRNALLRTMDKQQERSLGVWTHQLASLGGLLRQQRLDTITAMRVSFAACSRRLAPGGEALTLAYRGAGSADAPQEDVLLAQLAARAKREREVGYTLAGPHRDDFMFLIDGRPADSFASEGQLKSALIAWKMAEVLFLEQDAHGQPVLLLDDALSELDDARAEALIEVIDEFEQVILTTARRLDGERVGRFQRLALDP